jgi:uncharacterized OsmC-like protein
MTIEAMTETQSYSPFHMLASGLAFCTFSILASWAGQAGLAADDISVEVRWTFADDPHRVGLMDLQFIWPSLPDKRLAAALRVAELCAVHATLQHSPAINIQGKAKTLALVGPSTKPNPSSIPKYTRVAGA